MTARRIVPRNLWYAVSLIWQSSRGWTVASVAIVVLQAVLALAALALLKLLIDAVVAGVASADPAGTLARVSLLIGLAAVVALLSAACSSIDNAISAVHRDLVIDHVQNVVHAKAAEADIEYYENADYANSLHRAQVEAPFRATTILTGLLQAGRGGVWLAAIAGLLFAFNGWVALVLVLGDIPGALVRIRTALTQYQWDREHASQERRARYFSELLSARGNAQELRLLDLSRLFGERFRALRQGLRDARRQLVFRRVSAELAGHASAALAMYVAYGIIAYQGISGAITLGDVVMYYAAFQRSRGYLHDLLFGLARFYESGLFLTELSDFLALEQKVAEPQTARPVPRPLRTGIAFEHVEFSYPGAARPALHDVNLAARPGERIAIVGLNGSGKTTLVKLLCRLYDPSAGQITADGIALPYFAKDEWRRAIGAFLQDHGRYYLSARENIRFGNLSQHDDDAPIVAAALRSGAHGVIDRLPNRYDTVLGTVLEQGAELSAGEWQKVALARTFMRDAQLVILDEPTNAMDASSEQLATQSIWAAVPERITILISHRLSAVRQADRIYVLADGRIVQSGTHDELMGMGGNYADLFATQAQHYQ